MPTCRTFTFAALSLMLAACEGAPFTTAELFAVDGGDAADAAPEGAPDDAAQHGERPGDAVDGGDADASTPPIEAGPEAATAEGGEGGGDVDVDAGGDDAAEGGGCGKPTGVSAFCGYDVTPPGQFIIDFGVYPGSCAYAHHTHPIVETVPEACVCNYTCACLEAAGMCDQPAAPEGSLSTWDGCGVGDPATGMLVVTCQ